MCKFFSAISNGRGRTLFFTVEDICKEMSTGNKKEYSWNSHTSIASFHGITGAKEDNWNKWEYDHNTKVLSIDGGFNTEDDGEKVKQIIEGYLDKKDIGWLVNFYNSNSGDSNSGHWNSGDSNSGDSNSGDSNSGNWNSGNWNSGDSNSGDLNSNTPDKFRLFNSWVTKSVYEKIKFPNYFYFDLNQWISHDTATDEEKVIYKTQIETSGGFLKKIDYKTAWRLSWDKASLEDRKRTLKLPKFNNKVFLEITGIDVRKELK